MRWPVWILLCIIVAIAAVAQSEDCLVLTNLVLIDGSGAPARPVAQLVVRGNRIAAIVDAAKAGAELPAQPRDTVTTLDLDGASVMPGLIDTHVHVARFPRTRETAEQILRAAVLGGVTTVRDMAGDARPLAELSRAQQQHELVCATPVFSAVVGGPSLFDDPRFADFAPGYPLGEAPWARVVTAQTDLTRVLAEARGAGVTGIKLYANMDAALVTAIVAEAHRQQLRCWAHATVLPARPSELVAAGVDALSHAPYLVWEAADTVPDDYAARIAGHWAETPADHPRLVALLDTMAARRIFLDPTLYVFRNMAHYSPEVQANWTGRAFAWAVAVTAQAYRQGVPIVTGTDWFEPGPGETLPHTHDELVLLVEEAGLSAMDAIVAATRHGAELLGLDDRYGTVSVGKVADLLVLEKNPLEDIHHTTSILFVVKDGVLLRPEQQH